MVAVLGSLVAGAFCADLRTFGVVFLIPDWEDAICTVSSLFFAGL